MYKTKIKWGQVLQKKEREDEIKTEWERERDWAEEWRERDRLVWEVYKAFGYNLKPWFDWSVWGVSV